VASSVILLCDSQLNQPPSDPKPATPLALFKGDGAIAQESKSKIANSQILWIAHRSRTGPFESDGFQKIWQLHCTSGIGKGKLFRVALSR
jgi:hypothetical protein